MIGSPMTAPLSPALEPVARALCLARRPGAPLADASAVGGLITRADEAYAVQEAVADALGWFSAGPARHWKSGGPSRDTVLTHAPLPPAGVWTSPATTSWPFAMRGIEAEIALRLAMPVDAERAAALTPEMASSLVDAMAVSIEIVDSRWSQGREAPALAKLADLQSHGALVLGDWVAYDASRDWSRQSCQVQIGDAPAQTFTGTHSLGDPAWLLPGWLRHATRHGQVMPAGTVVTTGTWCGLLMASHGDTVTAVFDGVGEARVRFG